MDVQMDTSCPMREPLQRVSKSTNANVATTCTERFTKTEKNILTKPLAINGKDLKTFNEAFSNQTVSLTMVFLMSILSAINGGSRTVADPGFPVGGGVDLVWGAVDPRGGYVSKLLHVKTKESGPIGGACAGHTPLDPPMQNFTSGSPTPYAAIFHKIFVKESGPFGRTGCAPCIHQW